MTQKYNANNIKIKQYATEPWEMSISLAETFHKDEKLIQRGLTACKLARREYFEKNINPQINEAADYLRGKGVSIDRIAKNHAVAYAGVSLLMGLVSMDIKDDLLGYTLKSSMSKMETARSELRLADYFMDCIASFTEQQGVYQDNKLLIVHMPTTLNATGESWNKTELFGELKLLDNFVEIKPRRTLGSLQKCWYFKNEKTEVTK